MCISIKTKQKQKTKNKKKEMQRASFNTLTFATLLLNQGISAALESFTKTVDGLLRRKIKKKKTDKYNKHFGLWQACRW